MPRSTAVAGAVLALVAHGSPAFAADPPDDDAALQLADRTPVATASPAAPLRLYGEVALGHGWLVNPAGLTNGQRASLDLRYDTTVAPGLRAVVSDRLDLVHDNATPRARNVNALREAYLSWQWRPDVNADIGRVNVRHGVAWGYNPTDYFRGGALRSIVTPDPAALRENRLGTAVLRAQKVWSSSAVSAAFSPKLADEPNGAAFSPDFGRTNPRNRWLLTASHKFSDQFNPEVLLHGGADTKTQLGANLSTLLGRATVVFAEASVGKGRTLRAQAFGLAEPERWQRRAALGATYTTSFDLSVTAEADYSSAAPDRAEWEGLRSAVPGGRALLLQTARYQQELPVRRGAFFYATWRDALVRRLDFSGFVRHEFVTRSGARWLEARYHWDRVDAALQWQQNYGGTATVFGQVPQWRTVELSARFYF